MGQYHHINSVQLQELICHKPDLVLVDVRNDWEYAEGHIPHAKLIPIDQLGDRYETEIQPEQSIVCICAHGIRSEAAARFLAKMGYNSIYNLVGGMAVWTGDVEP